MGRHRKRHKRLVAKLRDACLGQSTVEFAVVTASLMCVVTGLSLLWNPLGAGAFVDHALLSASHHVQAATGFALADVFVF